MLLDQLPEDVYLAMSQIQGGLAVGSVCGKTFWVDSSNATAHDTQGRGTFKNPFATINYAIAACTADRGDTVMVMPGHRETFIDTQIDIDVAGVTVRGIGRPGFRAELTLNGAGNAASILLTANAVSLENIVIVSAYTTPIDYMVHVNSANGAAIRYCQFQMSGTNNPNEVVRVTTSDDLIFENNRLCFAAGGDINYALFFTGACSGYQIKNNFFSGVFSSTVIKSDTSGAVDVRITDNQFYNGDSFAAASPALIDLMNSTEGIIANNVGYYKQTSDTPGDLATAIDGGTKCALIENYTQNAGSETGGITGGVRST